MVDGDVRISETVTVCDYITSKSPNQDLAGKGNDRWFVSNVCNMINNIFLDAYLAGSNADKDAGLKHAQEKLAVHL